MAIAKLLHEGETVRQLKNVIKYNTVAKEHLNSASNPRLLQAISNLGIIDISDAQAYQHFMTDFVSEISLNQSLSTNKRQTKLYAHEVVSFENADNKRFKPEELAQIAIEILDDLYDMANTPYVIWPQLDSGRLHFHIVRSMYSSSGIYQRVKNSKLKMRKSCEKTERKYDLSLTGRNVSNEIKPTNNPMLKVIRNLELEAQHNHQKALNEAIKQDTTLSKFKRKSYDLVMDSSYQSKAELAVHQAHQKTVQTLEDQEQTNNELEAIKNTIFNVYKGSKGEADFIDKVEQLDISIELLKHSQSGKNKGVVFHYQGQAISGGKVSSSMTLGKIRQRYPNFIQTLEKPPELRSSHRLKSQLVDFQIEQINRYYKQRKNDYNDDILIYFGKKNVDARPHNYNLKLSNSRDAISFGPATPNDHDLTLSLDIALENGWKSAVLSNSNPEFLKRMMRVAYQKDPSLLFFVKLDKPHQLSYADLKEIKPDLTAEELKAALKEQLISQTDLQAVHQDLVKQLTTDAQTPAQQGYALALDAGFKLEELEKKTTGELQQFYHHHTFQISTEKPVAKSHHTHIIEDRDKARKACLEELMSEARVEAELTPTSDLKENKRNRYNRRDTP